MPKIVTNLQGSPSAFSLEDLYLNRPDRLTSSDETAAPPALIDGLAGSASAVEAGLVAPVPVSAKPLVSSVEIVPPFSSFSDALMGVPEGKGEVGSPAAAGDPPPQAAPPTAPMDAAPAANSPVAFGERLLVQWSASATEEERREALEALGGVRKEVIHTNPMKARGEGVMEVIQLPAGTNVEAALAAYDARPGVRYAEIDQLVQTQAISNDTNYSNGGLWGMYGSDSPMANGPTGTTNIFGSNAEAAWNQGFTGSKSVCVGILDSGIDYEHEDLAANMWVNPYELEDGIDNDGNGYVDDIRGWNFLEDSNVVLDRDADYHGTHVAGTIGAVGGNGIGTAGVNWDVTMIAAKFMGYEAGYISGAIQALDYVTDLKWRHGLNIVATNNSWIAGSNSRGLYEAIVRSARQDILFVVSAGNRSTNNDTAPAYPSIYDTTADAGYDSVIAVAAITQAGQLDPSSSYGPNSVDLGAPGRDILSTLPWDDYSELSGTSMATPHVTGALALYASQYPGSTAEQIRAALMASAIPTPSLAGMTATGGRLDVMNYLNTLLPLSFGITADQAHLAEGQSSATSFGFTITRHGNTTGMHSVSWQVAGTGSAPADGQDFVGQTLPGGTVTFAPGESRKTITIEVNADTIEEGTEAFNVTLVDPSGGATLASARTSASSRILNDDGLVLAFHPGAITIPSFGPALPSHSTVTVSTATPQVISSLEVTLYNFYHSSLDDIDILLVGPTGATSFLMSDCGGANPVNGITLSFSPRAAASLPDEDLVTSGTWLPTNSFSSDFWGQPNNDSFGSGVVPGPYNADLSVFNGTNPNGVWSLFVKDDAANAAGKIMDGWSLSIETQPATSTVSLAVTPNSLPEDGSANLIYTFSRSGPTTNPLTVNYTVGGTANLGSDYTGIASQGATKSVTFAVGSSTATVVVDPKADNDVEANETVSLSLLQGTEYTIGTVDPVIGTIQDDDTLQMEGSGTTRLMRDATNRLYVQSGSATPTGLRFRGRPIFQNSFSGWEPLAAETFSGLNQMLWKNVSGNYLSLWTMDSNWNWLSSTGEWGINTPGAILQELNFGLDINGNGILGSSLPRTETVLSV
jgi:subtilisin family serine protease